MVRTRLPLGAIILVLCSLALASSGGDTPPHRDNGAASNVAATSSSSFLRRQESIAAEGGAVIDKTAFGGFVPREFAFGKHRTPASGGMDSRLRGNDGLIVGGLLAIANDGNFADFYRQQQSRILSHIDDTIATQAERAITDNFAAVKRAGVKLQTKLGGRKGNIGVNLIGSFADGDSYAFGWQLRGFGGEDDTKGANVGLFYRTINDGLLFGINAFADYEDGDYGDFSRLGFGGEVRNAWLGLHANYYKPITDEKRIQMTVAAFSRQGFDAKLRLNAPDYRWLKWAADYYNYDGKRGTKRDDGLRIGAEADITPALNIGLFYDDGAEEFGGALSYSHTIGESQTRHSRAEGAGISHSPDLFAPVSREYSQRIATVAAGPAISLDISIVRIITTAMTTEAMTITTTRAAGFITITTIMTALAITTTTTMTAASITTTTTMTAASITTTTTMTAASITTTTTMTAASITTTTTMTAASITTTTTMTTTPPITMTTTTEDITMTERTGSVLFTTRSEDAGIYIVATTAISILVTLPPATTARPHVLTIMRDFRTELDIVSVPGRIIESSAPTFVGQVWRAGFILQGVRPWTITIAEGSEAIVSEGGETTMTTSMTITMDAVVTETTMTMMGAITETTMTMMGAVTETTMTMQGAITETTMTMMGVITETTMAIMGVITETTITMQGAITETRTTMALTPTTTTMTIQPVSTTTRITTFATMFITLTANAAMGDILPSSFSRPIPSFPVDSAGISKPKRRFPRLRRENDDTFTGRRAFAEITILKAPKGRPVHSTG